MKTIFYIGFYDIEQEATKKRNAPPSALPKMEYIIGALNRSGYKVNVVSPARTADGRCDKGRMISFGVNTLKLFSTVSSKNKVSKIVSYFQRKISLFFYLLFKLKPSDTVIVYHSLFYAKMLSILKKIKRFRLISEVEEIYADVTNQKKHLLQENCFFKTADAFIFPTHLLNEKVNPSKKPFVVIHGTYQWEEQQEPIFKDERIHIVYAGILDPRKGGTVAVSAAEFLDERYHIHILGYGTDSEKETLLQAISAVASKTKCKVTFDGLKYGNDYICFIQSCHIGLCPQDPNAAFTSTSFPSKILSYIANGLRVLSINIPAIAKSDVGEHLFFFDKQTAEDIAKAIRVIDTSSPYNSREILDQLDQKFIRQIQKLLS